MARKSGILVVGSINMDMVVRADHMPSPGETVLGGDFHRSFGGKGANQAVAAARLGADCRMIAALGDDPFGLDLRKNLQAEGVNTDAVSVKADAPTGTAMIIVDANGENSIVVASGANYCLTPDDDVFPNEELFEQAAVVLLQLELPLTVVRAAVELARRNGCKIVLDPAPAPAHMPADLFNVDLLSPNAREAARMTLARAGTPAEDKLMATKLISSGAQCVVLKLGQRGSLVVTADGHFYTLRPYRVTVRDTTGAGDAFTAALAVAAEKGWHLRDAARYANAAGAVACTRLGAQASMPTADEVAMLMADQDVD